MKNNDDNELERLLETLEQAGRNNRRRDEIATMVKKLAAKEKARQMLTWRVAACVAAFTIPLVFWLLSRHEDAALVAETTVKKTEQVEIYNGEQDEKKIETYEKKPAIRNNKSVLIAKNSPKKPDPTTDEDEEIVFMDVTESDILGKTSVEENESHDLMAETEDTIHKQTEDLSIAMSEENIEQKKKKKKSPFRFAGRSNMDGTVLAFKLN